jgi:hypothetical protein
MTRIALTDESGRWFNAAKAERYEEDTWWDGSNHISRATGGQWDHEVLWRTAGGRWILQRWSQWQGVSESFEEITAPDAAVWLVRNGHPPHPSVNAEFAALEVE